MSKLEFLARPLVKFDPYNKDHRRYYAEFVEYGGWGRCPVRFICPDEAGMDLTVMIRNQLVSFYIDREFGGSQLSEARAAALKEEADELYRTAALKRKEADALHHPRRNLG
jgi:hypothetical protein